MKTVLVVDDEESIRTILEDILSDEGYRVLTSGDGLTGLQTLQTEVVDCILLDVWLPGKGGMEVLEDVGSLYPGMPVIIISGHGSIDLAVKAVKRGAFDFVEKPISMDRITTLVRNAIEVKALRSENADLRSTASVRRRIVGQSKSIKEVQAIIDQSAHTEARVLITGENGTGKEMVAREIHDRSARREGPFVAVNCAAIPDTLIEAELFGHEKGAFTSAQGRRIGKFEQAHRGTLFLDEIADMSAGAQAKVLRVIQEMRLERLGGEESIDIDVRIIAATNKKLEEEIGADRFREDLFFRLNVIPIHLPPLRERVEDIPLLTSVFIGELGGERKIHFTDEAFEIMKEYSWPGNIRELKNLVERVTIMENSELISLDIVQRHLSNREKSASTGVLSEFSDMSLQEARDSFERAYLEEKLQKNGYNVSRTAKELGIYPSNLHAKIRKFGIEIEK